jgi:SOS-response transcriptional repressor LexA
MYHVLEAPSKRQRLNGTRDMIFDSKYLKPNSSASAEQVPIYQDVAELCPSLQTANETKRTDHNPDTLSPPKQLLVVPVYQEIAELSAERANQNTMHIYAQVPTA